MTLPEGLTTAELVGTFLDVAGNPDTGTITLTPNAPVLTHRTTPGTALDRAPLVILVNDGGVLAPVSRSVLATDNSSIGPSGWNWHASIRLKHRNEDFDFFAPGGTEVDLVRVAPTSPAPGYVGQVLTVGGVSPGPTGDVPIDSIPGSPGPQGPAGATGAQGPAGATGATGATGAQGPAGADGSDGTDGQDGAPGAAGATGPQGPKGDTGDTGATGSAGAAGAAGATGSTGPAGEDGQDASSVAARYGCVGISMDPHDLAAFLAMQSGRLYQVRVQVAPGQLISAVRIPCKDSAAGAGQLHVGVYQSDNSRLGVSGNVASSFLAVAETWVTVPLLTPATADDGFVWVALLSTMDTGPQIGFVNTTLAAEFAWMLNGAGSRNTVRHEGESALPGTLDPGSGILYLDQLVGVA